MSSGSLAPNAVDLTECCSNLFILAEINGLKWCKYTGNPCSLDSPLDDPILASFATALEHNVLCSWRHAPPLTSPKLNQGLTCSESPKELWLFWYGDDPRTIDIVDKNLKESDHGSWESGFPNEAKVLLFKAFHNVLERHLLSRDFVRVGKWFVSLDKSNSENRAQLFFSFAFCLQEGKICMTVDVKQLPGVRHLVPNDLTNAAALQGDFKVVLGPYGISATLTGHSYQLNGVGVNKLVDEWKCFYPLNVVDDWSNVPEGIEHDVPVVVGVMVEDKFIKYPSHYVLVSLEDEVKSGCCCKSPFTSSSLNSPLFPMTPPASPFPTKASEKCKSLRVPSTIGEREDVQEVKDNVGTKEVDAKAVSCELINNSWKDIRATKSTSKSSSMASAQGKSFSSTFKSDQEPLWNFKEPPSRKSCSCTSSSNISRSRVPPPGRSFGISRPSPSPSGQSSQSSLASKLKKDKEKKPILPFHQRPISTKLRNASAVSKGIPTCNLATHVADQNRQPNSYNQNEAASKVAALTPKTTENGPEPRPQNPTDSTGDIIFNNNNNNETYFKQIPPVPTRLSEALLLVNRKVPTGDEGPGHGYTPHCKRKEDIWKCYDIFTGDPKSKPRLPHDVLDMRDSQRMPLTTESVVSMPEESTEVFTIETVENESYQKKRSTREEPVIDVPVPPKRRRSSSSTGQSGRSNAAGPKSRTSRSNSSSKAQVPTPSPELTNGATDNVDKDNTVLPVSTPPSNNTRAQEPSTDGSAAGSPATIAPPVTSKPGRATKNRRASRKSQDRNKNKESSATVKQEPVVEPITTLLASPPTPKGSVSLRTEKDLQVTFSDLDKLFDSADEDEEDSKMRGPLLCPNASSPSVPHSNDDTSSKTKNNANNGPGVVPLTDLARMFPTPPSLENHQLSPNTNTVTDHFYSTNTSATLALTPPECAGHSAMAYSDISKNEKEERNHILASIKELPPIFEVPTRQDYVSSSSMFSPLKSLPSSQLKIMNITKDMMYIPSSSRQKAVTSKPDSSVFGGFISHNPIANDGSSLVIPEFCQGSLALNTPTLRTSISSPREIGVERPRTKYTPVGERSCHLLNANLFLSDSYLNYLADRSLDTTDACVCPGDDRKLLLRHLMTSKEPMGFTRNIDVCSCGLRTYEREKLKAYDGLFPSDIPHGRSCMDDIGVLLDKRYIPKSDSCSNVTKEQAKKQVDDTKPGESSELFETNNPEVLMECLLGQFSSSLSANGTAENIVSINAEDENGRRQFRLKSEAEHFSKSAVDFLFDLKPVIQESLHKAIRWKTWEQLSSVQGPLSLKQICFGKGSLNPTEPARMPGVIVGHDNDWLSVSPLTLQYWEKLLLEPYTSSRDVAYVVLAPDNDAIIANVRLYFKELSATYETCLLGHHVPVTGKLTAVAKGLRDGILKIGQSSSVKLGKQAVGKWFGKYDNLSDGPRMKLFAQVCKYELGPFIEKLAKERLAVRQEKGDDNSTSSFATSDVDLPGLREESGDQVSIVVYIVNPFDEAEDQGFRKDSYYGLLRSFSEMAASLSPAVRSRLVLEVVPLQQVTQVDAYQKTKGSHVSFVKLLKTTAFSVFSRCRLVLQCPTYPYTPRTHTGFWATPSQTSSNKNQTSEKSYVRVYSPAYILATPPKLIHNVETVETPVDLSLHKESSNLLFCCYGLSVDHRWLLAICTNDTGLIMETFVTVVEPTGNAIKQRRTRLRIKALRRLWEFCQGVTSCIVAQWRLVIGKLGRFSRNELRDWDEIIRTQSTENSKHCNACSSSQSHTKFESVSLVSLQNEFCLRIHLAKVSSPFSNYREPNTAIVETVSRPRISTTYIVINVESSQTSTLSHMDGLREIDSSGDLVDTELLMSEPHTEDYDEMPMMPLFGSIANILPSSKTSHLQQELRGVSPNERPSSAPMLTDPVSSTFVPISVQSPHPSQSVSSDEQNEQEKNLGFPLAHGRVFTTAPLGPVYNNFSRDSNVDRNSPVVLKASLLAHHVKDTDRHGNHVLSSTVHTSVLRHILEHYDALSWLSVDSVSKDRTSCLPIHYTALSQMTHAFNGLLQ